MKHPLTLFASLFFCFYTVVASNAPKSGLPANGMSELLDAIASFNEEAILRQEAEKLPFSLDANLVGSDDVRQLGQLAGDMRELADEMNAAIDRFQEIGNNIEDFLSGIPVDFPMGISQNFGDVTIHLVLSGASLKPTHMEVDVALGVEFPGMPDRLLLGATDVEFTRAGGIGDLELELLDVFGINITQGKSRLVFYPRVGNTPNGRGTYAQVSCEGLSALSIDASLVLSRDWVLPVREGEPLTDDLLPGGSASFGQGGMTDALFQRVHWDFNIQAGSGDFFIETGSRDTFVLKSYHDIQIHAEQISLDFSETRNPSPMRIPENYLCPYSMGDELLDLWQGVYIHRISIQLPESWQRADAEPIRVFGDGIIVDERGLTGLFGIENLLPLNEGRAGDWAFSVDTFRMRFMQSQVEIVRLDGLVNVPLLAEIPTADGQYTDDGLQREDCLSYIGYVEPDSYYALSAETNRDYWVPLWGESSLTIRPGTFLDIEYEESELTVTAGIHASVYIEAGSEGGNFNLTVESTDFDGLIISSRAGIVDYGDWSFPSAISASIGSFNLHISNIDFASDPSTSDPTLSFAVEVEVGGDGFDLAAGGAFRIIGEINSDAGYERYQFQQFAVDALTIDASTSAFGVRATIAFYNEDATYGRGFYGSGSLWFRAFGGVGIAAAAQFGEVGEGDDRYKYFMVDALAKLPKGIIPAGPFSVRGIGGGVWNNMVTGDLMFTPIPDNADAQAFQDSTNIANAVASNNPSALSEFIGYNLSGTQLVPSPDGFGIKVNIVIATNLPNEKAISINGTFQLQLNGSNGWRAELFGNATFFGPINWNNQPPDEGLAALFHFMISREPVDGSSEMMTIFNAEAYLYLKYGFLEGRAGDAMMVNYDESVEPFNIPGAGYAGFIGLHWDSGGDWWINIGRPASDMHVAQYLPNAPPPGPIAVGTKILGIDVRITAYFCLGTNIPPLPDLPHYVTSITGGESNFMRNESLYASGRGLAFGASLYLEAKPISTVLYVEIAAGLGFDINVQEYPGVICANTGSKPGFDGWYAAGQAWAYVEGSVGLEFKLFLVTVRINILEAGVAASLQMKGPKPFFGRGRLGVRYRVLGFIRGTFRMNFKVGKECEMEAAGGGDPMSNAILVSSVVPNNQEVVLPTNQIFRVSFNYPIDESEVYNDDDYMLQVDDIRLIGENGIIPGTLNYQQGSIDLEYYSQDVLLPNSSVEFRMRAIFKNLSTGATVQDTLVSLSFNTGGAIDTIPLSNVAYSYPTNGQLNIYPEESSLGYLQLVQGQDDLFSDTRYAVFESSSGQQSTREISYDAYSNTLEFDLIGLDQTAIYRLMIVPLSEGQGLETVDPLWTAFFRVSEYASFEEKMLDQLHNRELPNPEFIFPIGVQYENFDHIELGLNSDLPGLIQLIGLTDMGFFETNQYRLEEAYDVEQSAPVDSITVHLNAEVSLVDLNSWDSGTATDSHGYGRFDFAFPLRIIQSYEVLAQLISELEEGIMETATADPNESDDAQNNPIGFEGNTEEQAAIFAQRMTDAFTQNLPDWVVPFVTGSATIESTYRGKVFFFDASYFLPGQTVPNTTVTLRLRVEN
ncbi:MAG: hypothetical protein AAGF87_10290 [Bacteroidota bacterium]